MKRFMVLGIFCLGLFIGLLATTPAEARVGIFFNFGPPVRYYERPVYIEHHYYRPACHEDSYTVIEETDPDDDYEYRHERWEHPHYYRHEYRRHWHD